MDNLTPLDKGIRDFLSDLRECNPDATIVWVFWSGGDPILSLIRQAVEDRRKAGDSLCFLETVPGMKPERRPQSPRSGATRAAGQHYGGSTEALSGVISHLRLGLVRKTCAIRSRKD